MSSLTSLTIPFSIIYTYVPEVSLWDEIRKALEIDSYIRSTSDMAKTHPKRSYTWRNGLLFFKGRVVVPSLAALQEKLLHEVHDTSIGGHFRVLRIFKRPLKQFYWPRIHQAVQEYVKRCEVCQRMKSEMLSPAGLLNPFPIPSQVWDDINLDFIEGLPVSHNKGTILMAVDRLSRSTHFKALSQPYTAKIVAEKFVEGIIKLYGLPMSIISDKDPIFINKCWQKLSKMLGTKLQLSSAYHPQTER